MLGLGRSFSYHTIIPRNKWQIDPEKIYLPVLLLLRRNNDSLPNKYATLEEPSKFSLLTFPCFCILQYNYPLSCDTTIQVHWTYDTFKMANTPKSLFTRNNYSLLNKSMPLWLWFSPTKSMRLCRNPVSSLCSHFLVFCILQYNYPSSWFDTRIQAHWTYDKFKMANIPKSLFTRNNDSLLNKYAIMALVLSNTGSTCETVLS